MKTLFFLIIIIAVTGCDGVKKMLEKVDFSGSGFYSREGKKNNYGVKFSITLSAEQELHNKLGELAQAVARTNKNHLEALRTSSESRMKALVASTKEVQRTATKIRALMPTVMKSNKPKLRQLLVKLQQEENFLAGLVTERPRESLLNELFRLANRVEQKKFAPFKLEVRELALTWLAQALLKETGESN